MTGLDRAAEIAAPWREFPVARVPRPIVFLGSAVHIGDQGFIDGEAKEAWAMGAIKSDVALPDGVMELILDGHRPSASPRSLSITDAQPCEDTYLCDRGPRHLSAYRLSISGLRQPCTVIDPQVECWWPTHDHAGDMLALGNATVAEDDVTVQFPAFGGVLTEFLHAEFVEFPTCVVGQAVTSERDVPPGTAVPLVGIRSMVVGHLAEPLGGRVLLHTDGTPLAVLREGSTTSSTYA